MLVAAAVLPHPPLLVPEVASGAAPELQVLRDACDAAVADVMAGRPEAIVLVGAGSGRRAHGPGAVGTLAGFGVPVTATLPGERNDEPGAVLPLSLTIGAWLLARSTWVGATRAYELPVTVSAERAAAMGAELAGRPARIGLLAMGDDTARLATAAPGSFDERAPGWHTEAAEALACGDVDRVLRLDPTLATDLMVAGRGAWQVLAGAAAAQPATRVVSRVLADERRYGVGYLVATWTWEMP